MAHKDDRGLVTQAEYARMRKARGLSGGTREGVRKAVADGRISCFGLHKLVNPDLADKQWQRNTNARLTPIAASASEAASASAPGAGLVKVDTHPIIPDGDARQDQPALPFDAAAAFGGGGEDGMDESRGPSYHEYRTQREKADAEISVMTAAKMRGQLVDRAGIDRAAFEIGRDVRDSLDNCARRIAPELVNAIRTDECEAILRREFREILQRLATMFRERAGVV